MTILSLDLTSEYGSLAIRRDGKTVAEYTLESRTGYAHLVFAAIGEILSRGGLDLPGIDCFAVSTGPGAFTGLRVALATVKGLAEAAGKPAVGISKLRAMASFGTESRRAVVLDARRGDVYAAVYDAHLHPMSEETITRLEPWIAALGETEFQLVSGDSEWLRSALGGVHIRENSTLETPKSLAPAIARCAEIDLASGVPADPALLDANYVRRSDAELYWTDS